MDHNYSVTVSTIINAPAQDIWQAFVDPDLFKEWMYGSIVSSDWKIGSPIIYKGEWEGKHYEDKGVIIDISPEELLKATYFSPLSGKPDVPKNYRTITYKIDKAASGCTVSITQEDNESQQEADKVQGTWQKALQSIKELIEK